MSYEYKVIPILGQMGIHRLNLLGYEGWEFVAIVYDAGHYLYYFKRELK